MPPPSFQPWPWHAKQPRPPQYGHLPPPLHWPQPCPLAMDCCARSNISIICASCCASAICCASFSSSFAASASDCAASDFDCCCFDGELPAICACCNCLAAFFKCSATF